MAKSKQKRRSPASSANLYESLNETRLSLQRQARTLQRQLDQIEIDLLAYAKEMAGKLRTVRMFGFILSVELKGESAVLEGRVY